MLKVWKETHTNNGRMPVSELWGPALHDTEENYIFLIRKMLAEVITNPHNMLKLRRNGRLNIIYSLREADRVLEVSFRPNARRKKWITMPVGKFIDACLIPRMKANGEIVEFKDDNIQKQIKKAHIKER